MDYLQSMGMLSLIQNLEWPYLVQQSHKHFFIWAALDWAGILALPCWGVSIHVVRLLSATLPLAIATLPLDISHIFLFLGCIRSYDAVEAFIDRYNNWSILVLLLYLPSVLVTIGDAIHCEGDTFCLSTDSWLERFVPPMVLCIGFCHVVWLSLGVFRRRQHNVSKNFVLRTFSYWWWPYEVILRKTVTVMTLFLLQGTKCLFLVVAVDVASSLLHVVLRVYGNDARPRIRRVVSGILFFSLLVFTFVAILYAELMNPRFHYQSYWATVFGIIALCLTLGSVSIGFLMYLCTKSKKEEKSEDEVDVDKKEDDLVEVPEQSLVVWPDDDAVEMCDIEKGKH
jgi:glycosyltransferase involved in cell wall biosynthesis